jgi:GNAT superfamily N-acetyltransferase
MSLALLTSAEDALAACQALARQLEAAHAWCILRYAESLAGLRPHSGACWIAAGGGHAIFTGPSPFSFAVGLGLNGPVAAEEVDAVEAFFTARNLHTAVEITPLTDAALVELLQTRGYRPREVGTVLYRDLTGGPEIPESAPAGVSLRWAEPGDVDLWVEMLTKYFYADDPGPERRANMVALFNVPDSLTALAYVDGEFAGIAGGMLPGHMGVVPIFGSSTLPQFRQRGVHAALLNFRLRCARQAGAGMCLATATPGSDSERNLQRCGFTIAYEKRTYVK